MPAEIQLWMKSVICIPTYQDFFALRPKVKRLLFMMSLEHRLSRCVSMKLYLCSVFVTNSTTFTSRRPNQENKLNVDVIKITVMLLSYSSQYSSPCELVRAEHNIKVQLQNENSLQPTFKPEAVKGIKYDAKIWYAEVKHRKQ